MALSTGTQETISEKKNETIHWKLMNDSWKKKNMRHSQNYNWQCPNTVPILK
jgi:hypothetical protein